MRLLRSEVAGIAASGILVQALMVVSGPLVARMLGPDGRGDLFLAMVVAGIGAGVATASLSAAVSHAVAQHGGVARDVLAPHLRTWLLWSALPATTSGVAALLLMQDAPQRGWLALGTALVTLFGCWLNVLNAMLQGEGQIRRFNVQRVIFAAVYVGCVVALFVLYRTDLAAVVLLPFMAAQLVGLRLNWRALGKPTGDPRAAADRAGLYRFARRTFVSRLGTVDSLGLDALVVGILLAPTQLGLYAVAVSVTTVPAMALGGIATALLPRMAASPPAEATAVMRRWLLRALAIDLALLVGLELVIAPAIEIFFGDAFVPAVACARILIVARALFAMRLVLAAAAQAQGKGSRTSTIELAATALMLVGVGVGAGVGGIEGAAYAMLLAAAFSCACLTMLLSWRGEHRAAEGPSPGVTAPRST